MVKGSGSGASSRGAGHGISRDMFHILSWVKRMDTLRFLQMNHYVWALEITTLLCMQCRQWPIEDDGFVILRFWDIFKCYWQSYSAENMDVPSLWSSNLDLISRYFLMYNNAGRVVYFVFWYWKLLEDVDGPRRQISAGQPEKQGKYLERDLQNVVSYIIDRLSGLSSNLSQNCGLKGTEIIRIGRVRFYF